MVMLCLSFHGQEPDSCHYEGDAQMTLISALQRYPGYSDEQEINARGRLQLLDTLRVPGGVSIRGKGVTKQPSGSGPCSVRLSVTLGEVLGL